MHHIIFTGMEDDSSTVKHFQYVSDIGRLLIKHGKATVKTNDIEKLINDIYETYGIRTKVESKDSMPEKTYFIMETK